MTTTGCPPLEELFEALADGPSDADVLTHAHGCEQCSVVLEEHRQLEKDLYRLADPLPPSDLVMNVMAKVRAAPAPRRELKAGLSILAATVSLAVTAFVLGHGHVGTLGSSVANTVVSWHGLAVGLSTAVGTMWHTAAVPLAATLAAILSLSLVGLRKLAGHDLSPDLLKVS